MGALQILQAVLALVQALAPGLALLGIAWWGQRQQATGGQLQRGQEAQASAKVEAAIAQAEAAAPTTKQSALDRLNAGTA